MNRLFRLLAVVLSVRSVGIEIISQVGSLCKTNFSVSIFGQSFCLAYSIERCLFSYVKLFDLVFYLQGNGATVKVIKLGTWKKSNFDSAFLVKLVSTYLGQNRITHYQSSVFLPCVSFFNYIF